MGTERSTLERILRYLFGKWWKSIRFGPLVAGAVFECRCDAEPKIRGVDGFLTIEVGSWCFSVCVGPSRRPAHPADEQARCPDRAELYRLLDDGRPVSWGFRIYNGEGQQTLSVRLPNPYHDDHLQPLQAPDWSQLKCWDHLRRQHLKLAPDPRDRG